jgi:formiminoglutamase
MNDWLHIHRGEEPLIVSIPHAGREIPAAIEARLTSPWRARMDADWHVPQLYAFAAALGATIVSTDISRTVIDVNRDPSGASLYPGQATTGLCPLTTFDGIELYRDGKAPQEDEIDERRGRWFLPYHATLAGEIARLERRHERVVLYDAHAIRSLVPRLFDGVLPVFNIGTNGGKSCDAELNAAAIAICSGSGQPTVANGRFKGGYITRQYGRPDRGVHALQMELAMRAYLREPPKPDEGNWPTPFDPEIAAPTQAVLKRLLGACLIFAKDTA